MKTLGMLQKILCALLLCTSLTHAKDTLNLAVIPVAGSSSMEAMWKPMAEHLQKELGMEVNLKFVGDYAAVITGMQHKHVDIAYFGPESYVQAAQRANAQALVTELNDKGVAGYHSIIITKKSSNLTSLESLKGKTWAFTDPNSTSGTLVPSVYLKKQGINPQTYFSKVIYSGGHEASILSVKAGRLHAAATNDLDFQKGIGRGWQADEFHIIWTSDLIVGAAVAVRGDMPQELKQKIQDALLGINNNKDLLKATKLNGFIKAKDSDYNAIRELMQEKNKQK